MTRLLATAALLALLSGCGDGQPFFDDGTPLPTDPTSPTDPTDPGAVIGPGLPPGTVNPRPNRDIRRPAEARVREFQRYLVDRGVHCSVRTTRGQDISAACGQLGRSVERRHEIQSRACGG